MAFHRDPPLTGIFHLTCDSFQLLALPCLARKETTYASNFSKQSMCIYPDSGHLLLEHVTRWHSLRSSREIDLEHPKRQNDWANQNLHISTSSSNKQYNLPVCINYKAYLIYWICLKMKIYRYIYKYYNPTKIQEKTILDTKTICRHHQ